MTNAMPNFSISFWAAWTRLAQFLAASGLMAVFPAPQAHAQGVETTDVALRTATLTVGGTFREYSSVDNYGSITSTSMSFPSNSYTIGGLGYSTITNRLELRLNPRPQSNEYDDLMLVVGNRRFAFSSAGATNSGTNSKVFRWFNCSLSWAEIARRLGTYHPYTTMADPRLNVAQTTIQT